MAACTFVPSNKCCRLSTRGTSPFNARSRTPFRRKSHMWAIKAHTGSPATARTTTSTRVHVLVWDKRQFESAATALSIRSSRSRPEHPESLHWVPAPASATISATYYGNDASSEYNAFEAKVDKRFDHGLQFIAHYTFAHANAYNNNYYAISHPIAYGPNDFVRNQVFVINTGLRITLRQRQAVPWQFRPRRGLPGGRMAVDQHHQLEQRSALDAHHE